MKNKYIRASEAAKILCVTPQTIRKYHREGKIQGYSTPGGQTVYKIDKLIPENSEISINKDKTVHYCRASDGSKERLKTQQTQLEEKYGTPDYLIVDKKSLWKIL